MTLPAHYPKHYLRLVRFALVMLFIGMISGFMMQESLKKVPYGPDLPAGVHWEAIYHLALLHGHVIVIGALIPLAIVFMLNIGQHLGGKAVSQKVLTWGSSLYLSGTCLSVLLMLYKGYHFLLSVRAGERDFLHIDQSLFFGIEGLRHGLYGLGHTCMGIGILILVFGLWHSLPRFNQLSTEAPPEKPLSKTP